MHNQAIKCPVAKYGSVEDNTETACQGIQIALGRLAGQINKNEDVFETGQQLLPILAPPSDQSVGVVCKSAPQTQVT